MKLKRGAEAEAWRARFRNGPCEGSAERHFCVGPVAVALTLMPDPREDVEGWVLVGIDGTQPEHPWPDQVRYECREIDIDRKSGEMIGFYELAA